MKQMCLVSLDLPVDLIAAIGRAARAAGQTPQDLVRDMLRQSLAAPVAAQAPEVQAPEVQAPEVQASGAGRPPPVAVHLAFAEACGWIDLQSRLRAAGFVLRLGADGVLALHDWPANRRLIDSAALGQPLTKLTLRFRAPFPGQVPSRPEPVKARAHSAAHRGDRAA